MGITRSDRFTTWWVRVSKSATAISDSPAEPSSEQANRTTYGLIDVSTAPANLLDNLIHESNTIAATWSYQVALQQTIDEMSDADLYKYRAAIRHERRVPTLAARRKRFSAFLRRLVGSPERAPRSPHEA